MPKPDHEEGGAFQDELPGMGRPREPVEHALGAVAEKDELEVLAALARDVVEPRADRRRYVLRWAAPRHDRASR